MPALNGKYRVKVSDIYAPAVGKYKKCIFKICASKLKKKIQKLQMELNHRKK
jgi:hypothetical protein